MREKPVEEMIAMKVSANSILANMALFLFKLIAGILGRSSAMISDAVHSASDVFSTIIVIIGVRMSAREADKNHPYGHERFECVASLVLAFILAATGIAIGLKGLENIALGSYRTLELPNLLALSAAVISIVVKEAMYHYTKRYAVKIDSGALMADAWHHRSDALSSIGSFVGIFGAILGFPILDSLASIVICIFIVKAAIEIFLDATKKMTDESCDEATVEQIRQTILDVDGVLKVDDLRTRKFGSKLYVDVEINVKGDMSLRAAHEIAENTHCAIENGFPGVKHCMVHVNPSD